LIFIPLSSLSKSKARTGLANPCEVRKEFARLGLSFIFGFRIRHIKLLFNFQFYTCILIIYRQMSRKILKKIENFFDIRPKYAIFCRKPRFLREKIYEKN